MAFLDLTFAKSVVLLILVFMSATISISAPAGAVSSLASTNTTQLLKKRQCFRSSANDIGPLNAYDCDEKLPTLQEWITRMRDVNDRGLADAEHHGLFYTGLVYGEGEGRWDKFTEWIVGWMEDKEDNNNQKFYWWFEHINPDWRTVQADHIKQNEDTMSWSTTWGPPGTESPYAIFDWCNYRALASAAVHPVAYLLAPRGEHAKDRNWQENSAWARQEFWALTQNPNIQLIIRADPRPPDELGITEEEWCEHSAPQLLWERDVDEPEEKVWECLVAYDEEGNPIEAESSEEDSDGEDDGEDDDGDDGPDEAPA